MAGPAVQFEILGNVRLAREVFAPLAIERLKRRFTERWLGPTAKLYQRAWRLLILRGDPRWPALAPMTIRKKGHSRPLIETYQMVQAIGVHQINDTEAEVGIREDAGRRDGLSAAEVALAHEFGSYNPGTKRRIPARPHNLFTFEMVLPLATRDAIRIWRSELRELSRRV